MATTTLDAGRLLSKCDFFLSSTKTAVNDHPRARHMTLWSSGLVIQNLLGSHSVGVGINA